MVSMRTYYIDSSSCKILMLRVMQHPLDFYLKTLGFELLQTVPEKGSFEWGFVKKGEVTLMFQREDSLKKEYAALESFTGGGALTLYISIEDLTGYYEAIKEKVEIVKTPLKMPYGPTEFALKDPDGFILVFSDSLY